MTHFYSGRDEALGVSTPYVIEGLRHGEVVLVVMPRERSAFDGLSHMKIFCKGD
jgi:hypothetical protein